MTVVDSTTPLSVFDRIRRVNPLILSALVLAIAPIWQLRFGVIPDTSWIITMCERVLAGDRLYVDLIETNPPFTLWLYMPAVAFAQWTGMSPEIAVHTYCYIITISGLAFAASIVRRAGLIEGPGLFAILPVIVGLLVIFPGNAFTEREQLGVALLLPLLVLMAWRATPGAPATGWVIPIAAGVCASVIMMVKPYYAIMIFVPAVWVAWQRRSLWALFAPEYWAAAIICCGYLAAVMAFYPEFLSVTFPLLRDTYMLFSDPLSTFLVFGLIIGPIAVVLFYFMRSQAITPLVAITTLSGAAATAPLIYQGKTWAYHGYPSIALLLMVLAFVAWKHVSNEDRPNWVSLALFPLTAVLAAQPFIVSQKPASAMIEAIQNLAEKPSVGLIGQGIQSGHPITRMAGGTWVGRYCSDWLGAMAYVLGLEARDAGNTEAAARYDALLADYISRTSADLKRASPDIVILENGGDWVDVFLGKPEMAGFMDNYAFLTEDRFVRVFRRK